MDLEKLTLGEIRELKGLLGSGGSKKKEICDGGVRIVILQRGWVAVGRFSQHGSSCKLKNGYIVRRWGTTEGLGQLASKGPQTDTKLEPTPNISFHELTVVAMIECDESAWRQKCPA